MLKIAKKAVSTALKAASGSPAGLNYFYAGLYHLLRLGLGGLFVYAGVIKLLDPRAFARAMAQFDLAPEPLLPLLAVGLPLLEVLAGAGLILEIRGSLATIAGLLGMFLLALGYAVWMEMDIDCGCFTAAELAAQSSVRQALVRDLVMAGTVVFLFWRRQTGAGPARPKKFQPNND
jgi:uncharacterized membrane protein YphA (DoxX/SURF4 family)